MSVTDEMLMAYADGELDAGARAEVERAMRADRSIEERVVQFREQRRLLQSAYAAELDEPVPEKTLAALRASPASAVVVDFPRAQARTPGRTSWRYTALAASVVLAVGVGVIGWQRSLMIRHVGDAALAGGALARALSEQLSGDDAGRVRVGLSFLAKNGAYCRTFDVRDESPSAGLACRRGEQWNIEVLVPAPAEGGGGGYRTAGTEVPPEVLKAVEAEIAGEPLDRAGETAARAAHWRAAEPH
jgi:energy-converting hydrogenase Eha subunit A